MIKKADSDATIVSQMEDPVKISCEYYTKNCQSVHKGIILGLDVIFVEFKSSEDARKEAIRRKTYYTANWLLENIKDEKRLVDFFSKHFKIALPSAI